MISQLKERRNQILADAQKLTLNKELTPEIRSKFDAMIADADTVDADIKRLERMAQFEAEQRSSTRPQRGTPGEMPSGSSEDRTKNEKRAFAEWVRTGQVSAENRSHLTFETRDLGVGTVAPITGGSVLVPTGFDPQLHQAQKSYGALAAAVRQFRTDAGNPIKVATADDTEQTLSVIGEAIAVGESDPNLAGFTSNTDELTTGLIKVSNSLLADAAFDVDAFIQDTFAKRYWRGLSQMITNGNSNNIQAITPGSTVTTTSTGGVLIEYADLVALYGSLDPAYVEQSSFALSSSVRATLLGMTDNYGRPLLTPAGSAPFQTLFGRPLVISQYSAGLAAGNTPILFGDLQASYTLRTVSGGLRIARLAERYAELNEVGFIGYARAGGYNTTIAAAPSLVGLKMHV